MVFIQGGYLLKPRKTYENKIFHKPPHIRETYDWLVYMANWRDDPVYKYGIKILTGQVLTGLKEIQEGLSWKIGRRTEKYSISQIQQASRSLKKMNLITSEKTNEGLLIDISKYIHEQDPNNYKNENHNRNDHDNNYENNT